MKKLFDKLPKYKNPRSRLLGACLMPVAFLVVDFAFSPLWIDTHATSKAVILDDLLKSDVAPLGIYRGHHILVSIDDIIDPQYLAHIKTGKTALVISAFVDEASEEVGDFGSLDRAVLARLKTDSPGDYLHLMAVPEKLKGAKAGRVFTLDLHIPHPMYRSFPIDQLLIATLPYSRKMEENLNGAISRSLSLSTDASINNVIIPLIGIKFENSKGSTDTSLPEFFDRFFSSIPNVSNPDNIYVSLYKSWPTFELENVVSALNYAWNSAADDESQALPIHNRLSRLTEAVLLLCLVSCGFFIKFTVRSVLIISVSFLSVGIGSASFVDALAVGHGAVLKLWLQIVTLIVLSIGFPFFVRWNPKDLFDAKV